MHLRVNRLICMRLYETCFSDATHRGKLRASLRCQTAVCFIFRLIDGIWPGSGAASRPSRVINRAISSPKNVVFNDRLSLEESALETIDYIETR